jgi:hypothetical protein
MKEYNRANHPTSFYNLENQPDLQSPMRRSYEQIHKRDLTKEDFKENTLDLQS